MRHEIKGKPISVVCGYDEGIDSVYLCVYDERLKWSPEAVQSVNQVTTSIGARDGTGSYFDLHTGKLGIGQKVDHKTMALFLQRFKVPKDIIESLPLVLE